MRRTALPTAAAAALALALGAPAVAGAHVTLQPPTAEAGGYTVLNVRVPNEQDDQGTVKVVVQMPDGFASASYQKVPGWTAKIKTEPAPAPIDTGHDTSDRQVDTITFTGRGREGVIAPGEFQDFPLSVRVPDGKAGAKLTFKSLQTYEDGEVVRWIGAPDSEKPAPQVTLGAAANAETAAPAAADAQPVAATTADEGDDGAGTLAIVALIVGVIGLLAGLAGLRAARTARGA